MRACGNTHCRPAGRSSSRSETMLDGRHAMDWMREVSLVRRVTIGFGCCAVIIGGIGGVGLWALRGGVAADAAAWTLGALTVVGCLFALAAAWAIRGSIRESVEPTVQCVIRIAGGDLETKIESPGK